MKRHRKLLLFDIDGTLVAISSASKKAFEISFWKVFGASVSADGVDRLGRTDIEILLDLSKLSGLSRKFVMEKMPLFFSEYGREVSIQVSIAKERRIFPGIPELLETLSARNDVCLGVLTGNTERGAYAKLGVFDLEKYFPFGAYGDEAEKRSDLVKIAVNRSIELGLVTPEIKPGDIIVIGDSLRDIECAKANGVKSAAVATGWTAYEILEKAKPDFLFRNLGDVPKIVASFLGEFPEKQE